MKSPQSNGISEAFVYTLKRDYVHVSPLWDAAEALALIDTWIEDYNNLPPPLGPQDALTTRVSSGSGCNVLKVSGEMEARSGACLPTGALALSERQPKPGVGLQSVAITEVVG